MSRQQAVTHKIMSAIRSSDTKPEVLVRKYLFSKGIRYRKNDKRYPGHPDIVIPKYKSIVFVHGCFWHHHDCCKNFRMPKANQEYWIPKLERNRERDKCNIKSLSKSGWNVIIVWACELKTDVAQKRLDGLFNQITSNSI
jgi:DNA mismatch endonuclease, patch repair protein